MIKTICNACGNERSFQDSYLGRKFKCPACGNIILIDHPEEDFNADESGPIQNEIVDQENPIAATNPGEGTDQSTSAYSHGDYLQPKAKYNSILISIIILIAIIVLIFAIFRPGKVDTTYSSTDSVRVLPDTLKVVSANVSSYKSYNTGYYKKFADGATRVYLYRSADVQTITDRFLPDDVIVYVSAIDKEFGYIEYEYEGTKLGGWVMMQYLLFVPKEALPATNIISISEEDAAEIYKEFRQYSLDGNVEGLEKLFADNIAIYMDLVNLSKESVMDDQKKYFTRWTLVEDEQIKFERTNDSTFAYERKIKVRLVKDPGTIKEFLLKGFVGFDSNKKIDRLKDVETIKI